MAPKASPADVENAVAAYVAGESCQKAAAGNRTSQNRLKDTLVERGLWRTREQSEALRGAKIRASLLAHTPLPIDEIARRYLAGESTNALAKAYGAVRSAIDIRLKDAGVTLRSETEANRLVANRRTPEQNRQIMRAAHETVRGSRRKPISNERCAVTREARGVFITDEERMFAGWIAERGIEPLPQKAIGPYNVDIAAGTVAVEIFGGGWHAYGVHKRRSPERFRYILDQGWNLVIIWVSNRRYPLATAAADYVVAFAEQASSDPSMRGKNRVIWGDGKAASSVDFEVDDLAVKPPRSSRLRPGASHKRSGGDTVLVP